MKLKKLSDNKVKKEIINERGQSIFVVKDKYSEKFYKLVENKRYLYREDFEVILS